MSARPPSAIVTPPQFSDGLGVRVRLAEKNGEELEVLRVAPELVTAAPFEFAVRERVNRLVPFRHESFARVRRVDRFDTGAVLGVVSEHATGVRLSQLLGAVATQPPALDVNAALSIARQLVSAVAALHALGRDVAHGALAPERILLTPQARIVVTDYVLGSALDQLRLSRDRLWRNLQIAVPPGAGQARLDHRADIMQLGAVAIALVLGRPLGADELRSIPELVSSLAEIWSDTERRPASASLKRWLLRMLQADPRGSYESAADAQQGLADVQATGLYAADDAPLAMWLTRWDASTGTIRHEPRASEATRQRAPLSAAARTMTTSSVDATADTRSKTAPPQTLRHSTTPPADGAGLIQPLADSPQERRTPSGRFQIPKSALHASAAVQPLPSTVGLDDETGTARKALRRLAVGRRRRVQRAALATAVALAGLEMAFIAFPMLRNRTGFGTGTLVIESRPAGVPVVIDGAARGKTPLSLPLRQGAHVLELRAGEDARVVPVTIQPGATYAQYVELPSARFLGVLDVRELPGARVLVDGDPRGTSPVRIVDLTAGVHEVVLESRGTRVRRRVRIDAGKSVTLGAASAPDAPAPMAAASNDPGWIRIDARTDMQVFERGRSLGSTSQDRIELTAGRHELQVQGDTGSITTIPVDVRAGEGAAVSVPASQSPAANIPDAHGAVAPAPAAPALPMSSAGSSVPLGAPAHESPLAQPLGTTAPAQTPQP